MQTSLGFDSVLIWIEIMCAPEKGTMSKVHVFSRNSRSLVKSGISADGIYVNQQYQNLGILFKIFTKNIKNLGLCPTYWAYYAPTQQCYNVF
jgi:hypothetical protein